MKEKLIVLSDLEEILFLYHYCSLLSTVSTIASLYMCLFLYIVFCHVNNLTQFAIHFFTREQESTDEVHMDACLNKTGKNLESEPLMLANPRMTDMVKNSSKPDLLPSASEMNTAQAKNKALTGTSRQTQSGPLVAGAISERMRILERFPVFTNKCDVLILYAITVI